MQVFNNCDGNVSSETTANLPCPTPTATPPPSPTTCPTPNKPKPSTNCEWSQTWCTWICSFDDCANLDYQWNFASNMCSSTPEDCTGGGNYWSFASNACSGTSWCSPDGPRPGDCEQGAQVWCEAQCRCVSAGIGCATHSPVVIDVA